MALVLADRVEQVTRTTGLGDLQLAETIRGRQSFQDVTNNGDTVIYVLEDAEGMEWEIGEGTVFHGTTTVLQRTTIRQSSNADAKISLSAGTHRVFLVADAAYLTGLTTSAELAAAIAAHEAASDPHPQYTTTAEAAAAAPVQSVNGETGTVLLDAADVGATPSSHVGTGGAQHANATTTVAGFMSGADKTKLDGIEVNAKDDQSAAEVPYSNATSGLTATDVQAAIDEVDSDLDAHKAAGDPHAQYAQESALAASTGAGLIGTLTSNRLDVELDQRITRINVALAGVDVTLTAAQVSAQIINLTGTLTANVNVVVSNVSRLYTFVNSTSGSFTVTVKTSAGTGVVVPQGRLRGVRCDGTNVVTGEGFADFPVTPQLNGTDIYAQSNILGTVSQSAGIPTGAIIERGSNANGEYVKYADGTLICHQAASVSFSGLNSNDSLPLPITFVGSVAKSFCVRDYLSATGRDENYKVTLSGTGAQTSGVWFFTSVSSATFTLNVTVLAIGRWF